VVTVLRSLLFTPANRPAAFDKALASGADCVCLDLEDAVPPDGKSAARPAALDFLMGQQAAGPLRAVRINALSSIAGARDLAGLADVAPKGGAVMLPKVESAAEVRLFATILDEVGSDTILIALVETAKGLSAVEGIAGATDRLRALMFGGVDLSTSLGARAGSDTMRMARSRVIHAAHAHGLDVLDVPELDFRNEDRVMQAALDAAENGCTGKAAIHPANIAQINAAFTPSADEIREALSIIAAFDAAPDGLVVIDGKLIEAPVIRGMQKRIALARAAGVL
jgi:citrate lyase subunit beta/citryl-CoA lyase/(S)-citramalyl-CoA lyase